MLFINLIKDYIICLSRLYGIVQKDKVAEIYNKQNEDEITLTQIEEMIKNEQEMLKEHFVYVEGNYFIHESVMAFNEFDLYMAQKAGKPYYIPNKTELLKYKDQFYFEKTKEYRVLKNYVVKELTGGDRRRAEEIGEDVQGLCRVEASPTTILNEISRHVDFKSEKQVSEIMNLVMNLINNTRLWSNNGFTPRELFEMYEKQHLQPLPDYNMTMSLQNSTDNKIQKVGRNDPCLCGSGKKYKKCCL